MEVTTETTQPTEILEADARLAACEVLMCHALTSADVYDFVDIGEHVLTLIGQARRFLDVAGWAA